ncbi:MAG: HlyC/CorC family transporter [Actinobacteria bacterium]|nr:HlyC/CorC family transporter [Actinomycetota bacterium]
MSTSDWFVLIVVLVLFAASVVMALAEMAFSRMTLVRALSLADEGRRGAEKLVRMLDRPERTINSLLLLALVAQLSSAYLLGILLDRQLGTWGIVIGLFVQLVLFFVVAEVVPKTYAIQHTDRAALRTAGFLYAITYFPPMHWLTRGLIGLANIVMPGKGLKQGPFVTEEDLKAMATVAAEEESIEIEERELIHSIFEFGDTVVREVMLPRPDMVAIEADAPVEAGIRTAIDAGFSRIPAYEQSTDNIVGLVYLKDLVARASQGDGAAPVRGSLRDCVFVPEGKRVAELLREMQTKKFHMAIVVDEHGDTAGLVTMEDVLEEIVGEITDEYDVETPDLEVLTDGGFRMPGKTPIDDVSEAAGVKFPDDDWETVGGLVFNLLGRVPDAGDSVESEGHVFTVERMEGQRIMSVCVRPVADAVGSPSVADATDR